MEIGRWEITYWKFQQEIPEGEVPSKIRDNRNANIARRYDLYGVRVQDYAFIGLYLPENLVELALWR